MKTIKTIFVTLVAMFTVNAVMAKKAGNLKVNMQSAKDELTTVEISSGVISHFEIDVTDAYGKVIYSMETDAPINSLKKNYDFSKLEDGMYWHTVKIDKEATVNKFEVERGNVEILEVKKSIDPFFKFEDSMLKMTFLNPQNEDVEVFIYNSSKTLITQANLGNDFSITKAIDFTGNRFGTYEVVLANGTDIHEYLLTIE
jgi:hypothetical protein